MNFLDREVDLYICIINRKRIADRFNEMNVAEICQMKKGIPIYIVT